MVQSVFKDDTGLTIRNLVETFRTIMNVGPVWHPKIHFRQIHAYRTFLYTVKYTIAIMKMS